MKIVLIRHGSTEGNLKRRYIGSTDEPLCAEGIREVLMNAACGIYPPAKRVYTSPMKRCIQTAELIYGDMDPVVCDELRECDFGRFEGKNYMELSGDAEYQAWIDSGGMLIFPGGESNGGFRDRCETAFLNIMEMIERDMRSGVRMMQRAACEARGAQLSQAEAAFIVHGGTIMSVLAAFEESKRDYFDWHVENGRGFLCDFHRRDRRIRISEEI